MVDMDGMDIVDKMDNMDHCRSCPQCPRCPNPTPKTRTLTLDFRRWTLDRNDLDPSQYSRTGQDHWPPRRARAAGGRMCARRVDGQTAEGLGSRGLWHRSAAVATPARSVRQSERRRRSFHGL